MSVAGRVVGGVAGALRGSRTVLGAFWPELATSLTDRAAAADRLVRWGTDARRGVGAGNSCIWLHGSSAGELLGAAGILQQVRERTGVDLVVTHFSPSGRMAIPHLAPAAADYPPLDIRSECDRVLEAIEPVALIFAAGDVWPNLVEAAVARAVPVVLINAAVRPGSSRLGRLARRAMQSVYGSFSAAGAVTRADADRLIDLGVPPPAVRVTGDAAVAQAAARAGRARGTGATDRLERTLPPRPVGGVRLIAGSTWPEDEERLFRALHAGTTVPVQLVLVPHQPGDDRVSRLVERCGRRVGPTRTWSDLGEPSDVSEASAHVVVDQVGMLAELYTAGDLAYVGGGYGKMGLHSVVEPAAAGLPVIFGDRQTRPDARALVEAGGARSVAGDRLGEVLQEWLDDPDARRRAGRAAAAYAASGGDAETATVDLVLAVLAGSPS